MSVRRGKVREYLGMTLYYTVCDQVNITIFSCIEEILTALEKADPNGKGTKSSDAPNNIFVVNKECKKMDQGKVVKFRNLVAKTLYANKSSIPYTCTDIIFLTIRVQAPDEDDWEKLLYIMQYIRGTRKLSLTLSSNRRGILKWWVDSLFAVCPNM